jgi:hypothetical protein
MRVAPACPPNRCGSGATGRRQLGELLDFAHQILVPVSRPIVQAGDQLYVLVAGRIAVQGDAAAEQRERAALYLNRPGRRWIDASHQPQQRRLSRAVVADQAYAIAFLDIHAQILQGVNDDHTVGPGGGVGSYPGVAEGRQSDQAQRVAVVDRNADVHVFEVHIGH